MTKQIISKYLATIGISLLITGLGWLVFINAYKTKLTNEELVNEISRIVEVPNEIASIAIVTDKQKLAVNEFLQLAENGDRLVIFSKSGMAVLYRPDTKKVVGVANLSNVSNDDKK